MVNSQQYAGVRYNELTQSADIHSAKDCKVVIKKWTDADEAQSMNYIESAFKIYSKDKHSAALRILFEERRYNPIQEIVEQTEWDGVPRCQEFLIK